MSALRRPDLDLNTLEDQAFPFGFTRLMIQSHVQQEALEVNRMEREIKDLKEQLAQKDVELADLERKVRDLQGENNCLCIKLEAKDKEIKSLKERMQTLEDEKKSLQEELASVQHKLSAVEDDVKKLNKFRESDQEKYENLEEMFRRVQFTLKGVVENLETSRNENKKLCLELKEARYQSRYVAGAPPRLPVQASDEQIAMRHLGEMCCQIQDAMYKRILPQHFTPIMNYKVENFIRDIEKLSKTEDEKKQALKRWEDLKTELQWSEGLEEALAALQNGYSRSLDSNPPKLHEQSLKEYTAFLGIEGVLKGWLSKENVNNLISIWKKLANPCRRIEVN